MIPHIRLGHGLAVATKFILVAAVVKLALLLLLLPLWRYLFGRQRGPRGESEPPHSARADDPLPLR